MPVLNPLSPECPWSQFLPGTVQFCEERLCAWVAEPANTWSNIGYLIAGLMVASSAKRKTGSPIHFFSLAAIYLFIGSSLFHATGTFWGEVLDVSAMFLLSLAALSINLKRFFEWQMRTAYLAFLLSFAASVVLLLIIKPIGIPLFALQVNLALILEIRLWMRDRSRNNDFRNLRIGLGFFALAFFFWSLDISGIVCLPTNHIFTGHSAWHLLNSITIYYLYMHYDVYLQKPLSADGTLR